MGDDFCMVNAGYDRSHQGQREEYFPEIQAICPQQKGEQSRQNNGYKFRPVALDCIFHKASLTITWYRYGPVLDNP